MQVIRDAILKPSYKRISMYVPVVTNCKADSPPMQFFVTRRSLWHSKSESESREGSLCGVHCTQWLVLLLLKSSLFIECCGGIVKLLV